MKIAERTATLVASLIEGQLLNSELMNSPYKSEDESQEASHYNTGGKFTLEELQAPFQASATISNKYLQKIGRLKILEHPTFVLF